MAYKGLFMSEEIKAPEGAVEDVVVDQTTIETPEVDVVEGDEVTEANSVATDEVAKEASELLRKLSLKVDGEEIEEELPFDLSPEHQEWMVKQLQLAKMANKRAQEAAEIKKQSQSAEKDINEFFDLLKENPADMLEKLGVDVKGFAEKVVDGEFEKMQMTEEERKIQELTEQLEAIKKKEEAAKKLAEEKELQALTQKFQMEFEQDLMGALNESALPKNPEIIKRTTSLMRIALQNKIPLKFKDIIPVVQNDIKNELSALLGHFPLDVIEKLLSDEKIGELSKRRRKAKEAVKKTQEAPPTANDIKDTGESSKQSKPKGRTKSARDFFKNL